MTVAIRASTVDSQRFGVAIGRLEITVEAPAPSATSLQAACAYHGMAMLIIRCPVSRVDAIHAVEAAGGRLMDTLVHYRAADLHGPVTAPPEGVRVREGRSGDAEAVGAVAHVCFASYHSHYHADPRLDTHLATEGYADWAARSFAVSGVADGTFVALGADDRPIGFATMRISESVGDAGLFAVHPDATGRGVFSALLSASLAWCQSRNLKAMSYSTQITNIAVQNALAARSFRLDRALHTFHLWAD